MENYTSDHIGKWYWLKYENNIVLAEEFSTELSRAVSNKQLIQGDAGVHVMSVNGKTMTSTLSSDVLIEPSAIAAVVIALAAMSAEVIVLFAISANVISPSAMSAVVITFDVILAAEIFESAIILIVIIF